jgi:peroxiredoxin
MDIVLFALKLLLAGIFGVAAVAKTIDRVGSRKAMTQFGVPDSLTGALTFVLPLAEMSVAIALVVPRFAWWGAIGALTLLILFTLVIAVNLGLGRKSDCHCLGQLHSRPIGWSTLARNLFLGACTLIVLTQSGAHAGPIFPAGALATAQNFAAVFYVVIVLVLAFQSWLIVHLIRQHGRLLLQIDNLELRLDSSGIPRLEAQVGAGLHIGSAAPSFDLPLLSGRRISLELLLKHGKPLLLIFSDPNCNPCNALLTDVASWEQKFSDKFVPVLISRGSLEDNEAKVAPYGLKYVLIQKNHEVADAYLDNATPSALVVGDDGTIRTSLAIGAEAIVELATGLGGMDQPIRLPLAPANGHHQQHAPVTGLEIGTVAPGFALPDLDGHNVELTHFKGQKTLLLFWDPECRFCAQMLPELKGWESSPADSRPALLVVSSGKVDTNRAMGLQSTVILDQGFRTGRAFGVSGTPSAILIDEDGMIASAKAVGAQAIRALLPPPVETGTNYHLAPSKELDQHEPEPVY